MSHRLHCADTRRASEAGIAGSKGLDLCTPVTALGRAREWAAAIAGVLVDRERKWCFPRVEGQQHVGDQSVVQELPERFDDRLVAVTVRPAIKVNGPQTLQIRRSRIQARTVAFACLVPGHKEAGMLGEFVVQ